MKVDYMLGSRSSSDKEAGRKVMNEIMVNWDSLLTKDNEGIRVLVATNRPFDLDCAVIERLPCRLMVNLPDASNRIKILKVILAKEDLSDDCDYGKIANMTPGYSGRDLKVKETALVAGNPIPVFKSDYNIRPLVMDDFISAKQQVSASLLHKPETMNQLLEWNKMYGEGAL